MASRAARAIARENRLHDRGVLLVGVLNIAGQQGNCVKEIVDPHPCIGGGRRERRGAREFGDREVQPRVGRAVASQRSFTAGGLQSEQAGALACSQASARGALGGSRFDRKPERQRIFEIVARACRRPQSLAARDRHRVRDHEGAATSATTRLEVPGLAQGPNRVAQRFPADPQPGREVALGRQPVAWAQPRPA